MHLIRTFKIFIQDKDLRIILGDFNETMAKIVFCGVRMDICLSNNNTK